MIGSEFADVLAAAQAGEEASAAVLWRDLQPRLLRYLRAVEPQAAEDIASEVWLEVARGLPRFRGEEPDFSAWLFTIARHRLIDTRRKAARRRTQPVARIPEGPGRDDTALDALTGVATGQALDLLSRLPADQAEVILLRVVAGLDTGRVAAIVGKRPGTVRVLQHRGLQSLARLLPDRPDQPVSPRLPEAAL
jgi:RNA polymerase sigma-70 factor, ECF subfamily